VPIDRKMSRLQNVQHNVSFANKLIRMTISNGDGVKTSVTVNVNKINRGLCKYESK
jgi:hypothetical protein